VSRLEQLTKSGHRTNMLQIYFQITEFQWTVNRIPLKIILIGFDMRYTLPHLTLPNLT
jgi:hypothetical protein